MTPPSDPRLLVMHGLRLKGSADTDVVAELVDVPHHDAQVILDRLVEEGLASRREGRMAGYALTSLGRRQHAAALTEELANHDARDQVTSAYRRFLALNRDLLEVCTAWQLREVDGESVVNDHSDPAHDAAVVSQLEDLHAAVAPICADLARALDRFSLYGPRLEHALSRLLAGDPDWFTKPMIPSYHTVWFELHEDLLATLGIERSSEEPA